MCLKRWRRVQRRNKRCMRKLNGIAAAAPETLERTRALLEILKRQAVVLKRSVPGFLVNRLAQELFRESIYLIEQGITTGQVLY